MYFQTNNIYHAVYSSSSFNVQYIVHSNFIFKFLTCSVSNYHPYCLKNNKRFTHLSNHVNTLELCLTPWIIAISAPITIQTKTKNISVEGVMFKNPINYKRITVFVKALQNQKNAKRTKNVNLRENVYVL